MMNNEQNFSTLHVGGDDNVRIYRLCGLRVVKSQATTLAQHSLFTDLGHHLAKLV